MEAAIQQEFPKVERISIGRILCIFFAVINLRTKVNKTNPVSKDEGICITARIWRGINFCTVEIKKITQRGDARKILTIQLWRGGRPILNKIITIAIRVKDEIFKDKSLKHKKKIEAIPWEIKYFNAISLEVGDWVDVKSGRIAKIFTSNLIQKKNIEWADRAKVTLNKTIEK